MQGVLGSNISASHAVTVHNDPLINHTRSTKAHYKQSICPRAKRVDCHAARSASRALFHHNGSVHGSPNGIRCMICDDMM